MAEKTTLLSSIPPAETAEPKSENVSLLVPQPAKPAQPKVETPKPVVSPVTPKKSTPKVSLLSQTKDDPTPTKPVVSTPLLTEVTPPKVVNGGGMKAPVVERDANEATGEPLLSLEVAEESVSISGLQMVTYVSFVFSFVLAAIAAVVLFKKVAKLAEERFIVSAKAFSIASVVIALHGVFGTYLYNNYLNAKDGQAPLVWTMAVWVLVGPAVGFIMRTLLARTRKANAKAASVDAVVYGVIFFCAMLGVSSSIKTNAALLFSIVAGFLMIVPIARSLTVYKVARARHDELNSLADRVLIYALLIIPALLPVLAFAHVCGMSDELTLLLINFVTFDFLLIAGLSMVAAADELAIEDIAEEASSEAEAEATEAIREPMEAAAADAIAEPEMDIPMPDIPDPEVEPEVEPVVAEPKAPAPAVASSNLDDPIIQFLNSEEGAEETPAKPAPKKPAAKNLPRKPTKPGGLTPPRKPGSKSAAKKEAPNAPSRLKAPSKPKKRF